jgi:hypothetical protein
MQWQRKENITLSGYNSSCAGLVSQVLLVRLDGPLGGM